MERRIAFIASTAPASATQLDLEDIPQEIRDEVEEIYAALKTNPAGRMRAEFDSAADLRVYVAMVQAYCAQRPAGTIRFRKSPSRGLKETQMDFRITDLLTAKEQETEQIRESVAAVKAAKKK